VAPDYFQLNLQVSRDFSKQFGLYLGVENLLNTRQAAPIVAASAPQDLFDAHFDASLVYGPIFGRMVYGGLRWRILPPEDTER
jgi:outer membrane receptor protein involved in Fe transport